MKKIYLFILAFFLFVSSFVIVYATYYSNMNKSYYFTIDESYVDLSESVDSSNHQLQNLVSSINQLNSNYKYSINVSYTNRVLSSISVYVYEKIDSYDNALFGYNATSSSIKGGFQSNLSNDPFMSDAYILPLNQSNILESTQYLALKSCLESNVCNFRTGGGASGYTYRYPTNNPFISNSDYTITPFTNSTYDIVLYSTLDLLYTEYSSSMLQPNICNSSSFQCYYKKVYLNDVLLETGDKIPSYYDLFVHEEQDSSNFNRFDDRLAYVYVGGIPKNNINNFKVNIDFNVNNGSYLESLTYQSFYTGRINHGSYYTYEPLNCSPNSTYSSFNVDSFHVEGYLFPTGFNCTSDLSSYDNIYLRLDVLPSENTYDSSGYINSLSYNLNLFSNYGYITNSSYVSPYYILDKFDNLPSDFGLVLSTNLPKGEATILSDDDVYLSFSQINRTTNQVYTFFDTEYQSFGFGSITNTNLFVYNNTSLYNGTVNLRLYLGSDILVSFNDSNNNYSYYDDNGDLTFSSIQKKYYNSNGNSYDISNFFDVVNSFVDSLNDDIYNFSVIVQNAYNLIPSPFDIFILVIFVFFCLKFLFKLINK